MKKLLALFLTLSTLAVLLVGCGGSKSGGEKVYVDENDITKVYTSPKEYKGKYVKLTGRIFLTPEKNDKKTVFQMWGNPNVSELNTVVTINDSSAELKEGDYVSVDGVVEGEFKGKNAFGAEVTALQVTADSVETISYQDATAPTEREVVLEDAVNTQNKIETKITKVEFAKTETRVYYTITNNSSNKYTPYFFDMKIVQNGKQMGIQDNYQADYPTIGGGILKGLSADAVTAFPPIAQEDFEVHFQAGHSDDYNLKFEDYTIKVKVD